MSIDSIAQLLAYIYIYQLTFLISPLQLIIFMALARGVSQMCCAPLTLHTQTAVYVAELMTGVRALGSCTQSWLAISAYLLEGYLNHWAAAHRVVNGSPSMLCPVAGCSCRMCTCVTCCALY